MTLRKGDYVILRHQSACDRSIRSQSTSETMQSYNENHNHRAGPVTIKGHSTRDCYDQKTVQAQIHAQDLSS